MMLSIPFSMSKTLLFAFTALFIANSAQAQIQPTGKRDTSFSIASSYRNEIKHHPHIRIADSTMPASVQLISSIAYSAPRPGRNLLLDLYQLKNKSREKMPAVLMVHGGGWRSGDRSHNHTLARQLAAKGFVTVTVEYRLSTEALFPAAVHDLKAAVRWVRANAAKYNVDTVHIAILGFSAGGELAAFVGSTNGDPTFEGNGGNAAHSSAVQAVIDIDGTLAFIHPESGEGDDSKSISAATYWFGYPKIEKPDLWRDAAPLSHVGKNAPPFLFINSSVDRMHAGREDFISILKKHNIYSTVKSFPDAPHTFMFFEPWFQPTLQTIDSFLTSVFPTHK